MSDFKDRYLTTKQLAELLHVKERKIYELASSGEIPCTRALGKLLFERVAIDAWLAGHGAEGSRGRIVEPPNVFLGSHDPLLEWCLRESNSGLATFFDGSQDGLERFAKGEGVATGLHIYCPGEEEWNLPLVNKRFADDPVVLMEWAWRERGLIVAPGNSHKLRSIKDLAGFRVVPRQEPAGSQILLGHYLKENGIDSAALKLSKPARTEVDAALAVLEGQVDAAFGLKSVAQQYRLDFVPVVRERFDLLFWRREWFEEPLQALLNFFRTGEFAEKTAGMAGYDFSGLGRILFNGR